MRRAVAPLLLSLLLGSCYPATEAHFSSSAPGGEQAIVCGGDGYQLFFHSKNYPWARISFYPLLLPSNGMQIRIKVEDDLAILQRDAERAAAQEPNLNRRWAAERQYISERSVYYKTVRFSGPITITWPPNNRFDIEAEPNFGPFVVPGFIGDSAVATLPILTIDGRSEVFSPITIQRRTDLRMRGINGC